MRQRIKYAEEEMNDQKWQLRRGAMNESIYTIILKSLNFSVDMNFTEK